MTREFILISALLACGVPPGCSEVQQSQCLPGLTYCAGACVNTLAAHEHCGGCGVACDAARVCDNGTCALECPPGKTDCGGSCVSLADDVMNCGECRHECLAGVNAAPACLSGACSIVCDEGWCNLDGDGTCETACTDPPEEEICNGIDDNGNGSVDEGFACVLGGTEDNACGNCGHETRTCGAGCVWGGWSACSGEGCEPGAVQVCQVCRVQSCTGSCQWGGCEMPGGDNGDPCGEDQQEVWRCAHSSIWDAPISQVCRNGQWMTFDVDPAGCAGCCGPYSSACGAAG